jgi:hypothetical protein
MGFSDVCSMTSPGYNNATDGWFNGRYSLVHLYYMSLSDVCSMTSPGYNNATDGWFNGRYSLVHLYYMSNPGDVILHTSDKLI